MYLFRRKDGAFDDPTCFVGVRVHCTVEIRYEMAVEVSPEAGQGPRHTLCLLVLRLFRVAVVAHAHRCEVAEPRQRLCSRGVDVAEGAAAPSAMVAVAGYAEGLVAGATLGSLLEMRWCGDELGGETVPSFLLHRVEELE